jgi:hypothetical protein
MDILVREPHLAEVHTDFSDLLYGCQATCKQTRASGDSCASVLCLQKDRAVVGQGSSLYESSEPFSLVLRFEGANHQAEVIATKQIQSYTLTSHPSFSLSPTHPDCLFHQSYIFFVRSCCLVLSPLSPCILCL